MKKPVAAFEADLVEEFTHLRVVLDTGRGGGQRTGGEYGNKIKWSKCKKSSKQQLPLAEDFRAISLFTQCQDKL